MSEAAIYGSLERPWVYRLIQALLAPGANRVLTRAIGKLVSELPHASRLLDVGCGPASWLWRVGLRPVGLDYSPAYAARFGRSGDPAVIGSATQLPFADGAFDGVWCVGVLHHLDEPAARQAVQEMRRVVRPGGYTVIFDGVVPAGFARRPLAWLIRRLDRGAHFRDETRFRRILADAAPGAAPAQAEWQIQRLTYTYNGLEGVFCVALKPGSLEARESTAALGHSLTTGAKL